MLILETGGLVAAVNQLDEAHEAVIGILASTPLSTLVIPAMCVAEACFLLQRDLGAEVEARFLGRIAEIRVDAPTAVDFRRMEELCFQYRDFPLGGTDASVVALAERLGITSIITLDHRHFTVVRPLHCPAFELLP